jgi:streptogramin lyase
VTEAGRGDGRHVAGSPGVVEGVAGARGLRSILVRRAAVALATLAVAALALVTRADAFVYWTNGNAIGRANLDGTGVSQSFITGASAPQGVAVDSGHIYWANFNGQSIGRANLDGTGANQNFIAFNCGTFCSIQPAGLAIDADFIYWTKFNQLSIGRANLDGTGVNQGFATAGAHPVGIAVGPPG